MSWDTASIVITIAGSIFGLILTLIGIAWRFGKKVGEWSEKLKNWKQDYGGRIESLDDSIDNIESSITSVDLPHMEEILHQLSAGVSSNNSVITELERSSLKLSISFTGKGGPNESIVQFTFDEPVEAKSMGSMIETDEELALTERELFEGREPQVRAPSPRRLEFKIPSSDFDRIAEWVPSVVEKLDQFYMQIEHAEDTFDKKVEERLQDE